MRVLAVTLLPAILCACSVTLPVRGSVDTTGETFTGTATGRLDRSGTLTLVSSKGVTCRGDFVYVNSRQGNGTVVCDDKRAGPFDFNSTGSRGTGVARLGRDTAVFTFGD